jgi:hypothetical protein
MIQKEHLSWLTSVPATDGNFLSHLKEANLETIFEAIKIVEKKDLQMTKLKKLKAELKRKETFIVVGRCMGKSQIPSEILRKFKK